MNANPSIGNNPADLDSFTGSFRFIFAKLMQSIDGALPAKVIAFNRATNLAQVQPTISVIDTNGNATPRAQIASVPVLQIGAGNFMLNFPVNTGDLGWIVALDRDISNFLNSYQDSSPNTFRVKNFADSFFIPNILTNYTIAGGDVNNAVLQSTNGQVKLSLGMVELTLSAPTINIDAATEANMNSATVNISATGELNIMASTINITTVGVVNMTTPTLAVVGNITATGSITPFV